MKIVYDIAFLGRHCEVPCGKAGIFRVVQEVAAQLNNDKEKDPVLFCVSTDVITLKKTVDYLKITPPFVNTTIIFSPFLKFIYYFKMYKYYIKLAIKRLLGPRGVEIVKSLRSRLSRRRLIPNMFGGLNKNGAIQADTPPNDSINIEVLPPSPLPMGQLKHFDIYHTPYYPIPEKIRKFKKLQRFITIHDLIPLILPHFFTENNKIFFKKILASIKADDWVICMSNSTKKDLLKYIDIDPDRIFVIYSAADKSVFYPCNDLKKIAETKVKYNIPDKPYLLSVCTLEPRKNLATVIKAFFKLDNPDGLHLVLVGAKGWDYEGIFEEASRNNAGGVTFTGFIEDQDLAAIYSGAECFLYPSFYEGFGLPVLEAMQCGTPVITSNTSSMPELVGDAGLLVSPDDECALQKAILKIVDNPSFRKALSLKAIERAQNFSWEKTHKELLNAYQAAIDYQKGL